MTTAFAERIVDQIDVEQVRPVYERHCKVLRNRDPVLSVLSVAALSQLDFCEKSTRSEFFNSGCHTAVLDYLFNYRALQSRVPANEFAELQTNLFRLILNVLGDKTSRYMFLTQLDPLAFNSLARDAVQLRQKIELAPRSLLQVVSEEQMLSDVRILRMVKILLEDQIVAVAIANKYPELPLRLESTLQ